MKKKLLMVGQLLLLILLLSCNSTTANNNKILFQNNLLAVENDGLWGYIDKNNNLVIDYQYDFAGSFYGDTAIVRKNQVFNVLDKDGELLFDQGYDYLFRDQETGNIIFMDEMRTGLMDKNGKIIRQPSSQNINVYYEKRALLIDKNSYNFLDESGELISEEYFDLASYFSNGLAVVSLDGVKKGYIDLNGNMVLEPIYDIATNFNKFGTAVVGINDGTKMIYYLIDKNGNTLLESDGQIRGNGPLYFLENEGMFYVYDFNGDKFIDSGFTEISSLHGYIIVYEDQNQITNEVLYNEEGTEVARVTEFSGKHLSLKIDGIETYALIEYTDTGSIIHFNDMHITIPSDGIMNKIDNERILVVKNKLYGVINYAGEIELDFQYQYIEYFNDGYYLVQKNDLWGVIAEDYSIVIPIEYDNIFARFNDPSFGLI